MPILKNQSAISEVRDQLSLDFADGEYLNVVSQNLGMERPIIGFSDDVWRALVKQLAIEYKQLLTQFYKMMEIVFGVQVTQVGTLKEAVAVGDNKCVLNETSQFPQVGTLIFDEGLATEETHNYCYIDRHTGTVYLDGTTFAFAHITRLADAESTILCSSGSDIVVSNPSNFPDSDFPYPVVLGRGTDNEEVISVTGCDTATGVITLSGAPTNSHADVTPSDISNDLAQAVYLPSSFVSVDSTEQFPNSGIIRLRPTNTFAVAANVSPSTNRVVTVAANTFVADSLIGFEVVFLTGTLTGRKRRIMDNGTASITVDVDWDTIGSSPQLGDTFAVFPIVEYTSNDDTTGVLNLREMLDLDTSVTTWDIPNNSVIELMDTQETVAFSPVKSPGKGWDIFQSTPGTVEIYIPTELETTNDLRSASYLHAYYDGTDPSTTLSANVTAGDTTLPIVKELAFPVTGVVEINSSEQISYVFPVSTLVSAAAKDATSLVFVDTSYFGSTGTIILNPGASNEEEIAFSGNDTSTNTLTVSAISNPQKAGVIGRCHTNLILSRPINGSFTSGDTVDLYDPPHSGTSIIVGDHNQTVSTWEGPYVYNELKPAPTGATTAPTTLGQIVPGRTSLSISQIPGYDCLEVEDALPMLGLTPLQIEVGVGKGSAETVTVQEVSLRNRTETTTSAGITAGDTSISLTDFGGAGTGNKFPDAVGYRIVVDEANPGREVFTVIGRSGFDFLVDNPAKYSHSPGVTVRLVKDVLRLGSNLTKSHTGALSRDIRSTFLETIGGRAYFSIPEPSDAEIVAPLVDSITLASATGLDTSGGRVLLNFGHSKLPVSTTLNGAVSATDTVITVADGSVFPSSGSFIVTVGKGRRFAEKVLVTSRTGNDLTLDYGIGFGHDSGDEVYFEPGEQETVSYDEINSNDLSFDIAIMLNYTHYPVEPVVDSSTDSVPRDTGYDYPLRMPDSLLVRLQYLLDVIRAAGIQAVLISNR